ncbi:Nitrate reductase [NAD(P)H] [Pseudocercospora fuligena]|uniref:Nitrate reductase [NADPH] n=1 Tax=Pseudocercospora fuligena TaxID=685502 RepID=A0A8H6R7T0_9PEZI|nr:Nitrate reductase [NAD(P)H] [Pseudocercospora fuligena]
MVRSLLEANLHVYDLFVLHLHNLLNVAASLLIHISSPSMPGRTQGWTIQRRDHPGSTAEEINTENGRNSYSIKKGIANGKLDNSQARGYHDARHSRTVKSAQNHLQKTKKDANSQQGKSVNFQDAIQSDKDFGLQEGPNSANRPYGHRFVLDFTEKGIKKDQEWPANVQQRLSERKQQEEEAEQQRKQKQKEKQRRREDGEEVSSESETDDDRDQSSEQDQGSDDSRTSDEDEDESKQLSPQEKAFLRAIRHEKDYMSNLELNDGRGRSNVVNNTTFAIDEADQFTPDNWIVRSPELIRLVGKHPLNAEADLTRIYESGFITPNEIHYVRSHGAVPRLIWEYHELEVECGDVGVKKTYSMNDIKHNFDALNLPIFMACDNSRRKEMKMLKRTKGFNWGPGAVGCAYWKGPLLRDVLLASGIPEHMDGGKKRYFIHFRGSDVHNEDHYETSIPLEFVMDLTNDVLLAYEMNDVPLPPDHGYPLRVIIPGYVGGRHVKWLEKTWISTEENQCYLHIWDNRVVPSFVTDIDSELANYFFHHPDTACYEQHLNSVITVPRQGDKIDLKAVKKGKEYRIEGFAYNGRGDKIERIEVSLDEGDTWLCAIRTYPQAPIRHDKKFWTWCFWHIDVEIGDLVRSPGITVRAFDVKKMTQPEKIYWNILGSMNNSQYTVRPEIVMDDDEPHILFRHPVEPGDGDGGWMKQSAENEIADAQQTTDVPDKQFTKEEIEKHSTEQDCWIVVDECVYDATSVLSWHPGGAAAIMPHAGMVHQQTSSEFASVHDEYAYGQLHECILGSLTESAKKHIQESAEQQENPDDHAPTDRAVRKHSWNPARLIDRNQISKDAFQYKFQLPQGTKHLGLGTCQHIQFGFHMRDRMLVRPYTPTKPVLDIESDVKTEDDELHDGKTGTFELTVKTYFADKMQPGGAFSNILANLPIGSEIEMKGPEGDIIYLGNGKFSIRGEERTFQRVSLVLGGTGLTPGVSLIARVCLTQSDPTELRVIDANKTEEDILLRKELEEYEKMSNGKLKITHVLSDSSEKWEGKKGLVDKELMEECLFDPDNEKGENVMLLCGPPGMIENAVKPGLKEIGWKDGENVFGL